MNHDVYICYDQKDSNIAIKIANLFEENNIKTWYKHRDYESEESVIKIMDAISNSAIVCLIYSKNASISNFVNTEIDVAFTDNKPIIVFNLDNAQYTNKSEFFLNDKPVILAQNNPESHISDLLEDTLELLDESSKDLPIPDVYLCYDISDELLAEALCHTLEKNKIKCYFKKRDKSVKDTKYTLTKIINNSRTVILINSNNAMMSNYVEAEIKLATSYSKQVIVCNTEKINKHKFNDCSDNLHWLDVYPDIENHLESLLLEVSGILGFKIDNPIIKKEEYQRFKIQKDYNGKSNNNITKDYAKDYGISPKFKKSIIAVSVIAIVFLFGLYATSYIYMPDLAENYLSIGDDGVDIDKYQSPNTLSLTTTTVNLEDNHCMVYAKIYEDMDSIRDYTVKSDYYDDDNNIIDSTNIKFKDIQKDKDEVLLCDYTSDKIITKVEISIFDEDSNQVYYVLLGEE